MSCIKRPAAINPIIAITRRMRRGDTRCSQGSSGGEPAKPPRVLKGAPRAGGLVAALVVRRGGRPPRARPPPRGVGGGEPVLDAPLPPPPRQRPSLSPRVSV